MMNVNGYTSDGMISIWIDGVVLTIPDDPGNRHRQMVAAWEALGNTIPPFVPPTPAVKPLERLEFWLTAAEMGVTKSSVIAHATTAYSADPIALAKALAFIEEAKVYRLEDPILVAMAAAEGITEPQLSALWAWASHTTA